MLIETNGTGAGALASMDARERERYGQALARAGVLLAAERLRPGDGPAAAEVAGFWLIEVKSREEAAEWARRSGNEARIEIREVAQPGESKHAVPDPVQGR
ncbi:MAG: YciI family protein [Massilia sp.]